MSNSDDYVPVILRRERSEPRRRRPRRLGHTLGYASRPPQGDGSGSAEFRCASSGLTRTKEKKGSGTPGRPWYSTACTQAAHRARHGMAACAALPLSRARSPAGVPPRPVQWTERHRSAPVHALPGTELGRDGRYPPPAVPVQRRCSPQAGRRAGRPFSTQSRPGAGVTAPPAGTALTPNRPASPGRRPFRARLEFDVTISRTNVKSLSLYEGQ